MKPYSHYSPFNYKQSNITVGDALSALNPMESDLANYGIYAGGGGLAGAGIGALVNALRGESKLKGALIGGGIGAGAGAGLKGLGDYALSDEKEELARLAHEAQTEWRWPWKTLAPELAERIREQPLLDNLLGKESSFQEKRSVDFPRLSGKELEDFMKAVTPGGQLLAGLGGGGLGALLGAGVGAISAPEGKMLRRALMGAGIGGGLGGLGGYFGSPHIRPTSLTYQDSDTGYLGGIGADVKTRPVSIAELLGPFTNANVLEDITD